jgi:hypothetical protein
MHTDVAGQLQRLSAKHVQFWRPRFRLHSLPTHMPRWFLKIKN